MLNESKFPQQITELKSFQDRLSVPGTIFDGSRLPIASKIYYWDYHAIIGEFLVRHFGRLWHFFS